MGFGTPLALDMGMIYKVTYKPLFSSNPNVLHSELVPANFESTVIIEAESEAKAETRFHEGNCGVVTKVEPIDLVQPTL